MADDNGLIADIEAAIVTALTAVELSGETVFKTVDHWKFQIVSPDNFERYAPFAFVKYGGTPSTNPEGGHDLNQHLMFEVAVGTIQSKVAEGARIGIGTDAKKKQLGVSRLRDLVITALQEQRPTTTSDDTEYFEFLGDSIVWDQPKQFAIIMRFRIDRVAAYNPA